MPALQDAIATVPAGRWAIGVSGGADSVALARLMAERADCSIVLAHLNHQLRGKDSDDDAAFVARLAKDLGVPMETASLNALASRLRADLAPSPLAGEGWGEGSQAVLSCSDSRTTPDARLPLPPPPPSRGGGAERNPSAKYRAARLAWFANVVHRRKLDGVLLAHHADDQAETVLLQLLRGRGLAFLGGIRPVQTIDGMVVRRPLLSVRRSTLRDYLNAIRQPWREDSSNVSTAYRRNVLRQWLANDAGWHGLVRQAVSAERRHGLDDQTVPPGEDVVHRLLRLAEASKRWRAKLDVESPLLEESFLCDALRIPTPFAEHAARRWLTARGAPPDRVSPTVCQRLILQATDVSQPPRQHYPGGLLVRRRARRIDLIPSPPLQSRHTHGQETAPTAPAEEL